MEATRSFETLVPNHHITQCNNPEDLEFYLYDRENLKFFVSRIINQKTGLKIKMCYKLLNVSGRCVDRGVCHRAAKSYASLS
jgi:hypothetical protein